MVNEHRRVEASNPSLYILSRKHRGRASPEGGVGYCLGTSMSLADLGLGCDSRDRLYISILSAVQVGYLDPDPRPRHVCAARQGLVAPMTNAGQDGDASIGVGEEVYVSVTAYAVEVTADCFGLRPSLARVLLWWRSRGRTDRVVFLPRDRQHSSWRLLPHN